MSASAVWMIPPESGVVQAEAVVGFLNAWQKKPEETKYLDAAKDIWGYIQREYGIDNEEGLRWSLVRECRRKPIHEPISRTVEMPVSQWTDVYGSYWEVKRC